MGSGDVGIGLGLGTPGTPPLEALVTRGWIKQGQCQAQNALFFIFMRTQAFMVDRAIQRRGVLSRVLSAQFNDSEFIMTLTLLKAIAAPAIIASSFPMAASGIQITL
jgi:hypothetical protein